MTSSGSLRTAESWDVPVSFSCIAYITIDHWQSCLCLSIVSWGQDSLLTSADNPSNHSSPIFLLKKNYCRVILDRGGLPVALPPLAWFRQKEVLEPGSAIIHLFWIFLGGTLIVWTNNNAHTQRNHFCADQRTQKGHEQRLTFIHHIYCQSCSDHAARSCEAVPQPAGST